MEALFGEVSAALVLAVVIGLVELVKQFGVTGKWNQLVALVVGVAFTAGWYLLPANVVSILVYGALMGLATAGLYKVGQGIGVRLLGPEEDGAQD